MGSLARALRAADKMEEADKPKQDDDAAVDAGRTVPRRRRLVFVCL